MTSPDNDTIRSTESVASLNIRVALRNNAIELQTKLLGYGSYSKVRMGFSDTLYKIIAVKQIDLRQRNEYIKRFLPRELGIVERLKHPNIINVHQIVRTESYVCMITEYASHGDLLRLVKKKKKIDEPEAQFLFRQLIEGLSYLQSLRVIHRDLKCENLLLDQYDNLKIADFGFARVLSDDETSSTFCGSRAYVAHEIMMSRPYRGNGVDIWSAGIILYIMLNGVMPFDDRDQKKMVTNQKERNIPFSRKCGEDARQLILSMLVPRPSQRATIETIVASKWLQDVRYFLRGIGEEDNTCSTASLITSADLKRYNVNDIIDNNNNTKE